MKHLLLLLLAACACAQTKPFAKATKPFIPPGVAAAPNPLGLAWADQPSVPQVSLASIPSECKSFAVAVGQRLQKPGKERTTATGSLFTTSSGVTQTVQIVWQYPQKIRLQGAGPTIVFDQSKGSNSAQLSQSVSDMLEVLLTDSVEGMIAITGQNGASRLLGTGFREKGAAPTAPSYDIVQMLFIDGVKNGKVMAKAYWFSTASKLLAKVTYRSDSGSSVEVAVGDWRKVQGDTIPFLIERRENGTLTLRLTLSAVALAAGAEDGLFGGN